MTRLAYLISTSFVVLAIAGRSSVPITPKLIWNASASAPVGLYTVRTAADLGVTTSSPLRRANHWRVFLKSANTCRVVCR